MYSKAFLLFGRAALNRHNTRRHKWYISFWTDLSRLTHYLAKTLLTTVWRPSRSSGITDSFAVSINTPALPGAAVTLDPAVESIIIALWHKRTCQSKCTCQSKFTCQSKLENDRKSLRTFAQAEYRDFWNYSPWQILRQIPLPFCLD